MQHFRSDGEGLGSTFFVELPVYKKMTDRVEEVHTAEAITPGPVERSADPADLNILRALEEKKDDGNGDIESGSPKKKRLRVLIVDDSAANRCASTC